MKLTLGFSPCPNDCFIFDALLHEKIDTEGLQFIPVIEDVEKLNKRATASPQSPLRRRGAKQPLDITKLSFYAYSQAKNQYSLLDSGAALGVGVGPLVVARHGYVLPLSGGGGTSVAIPGKHTTANLLFSLAFPRMENKKEILFSEIEDAVLNGKADIGVIIHESRFTYAKKGLKKIIDLGDWWSKKTKCPIPLGGIVIKKTFPAEIQRKVNRVIRRSVEYAFANPDSGKSFIKKHAQEMDDEVIKKHINLYVNKYSISLGTKGRKAVSVLMRKIKANKK